jgi:hypothetical protein
MVIQTCVVKSGLRSERHGVGCRAGTRDVLTERFRAGVERWQAAGSALPADLGIEVRCISPLPDTGLPVFAVPRLRAWKCGSLPLFE